jgi:hypothetical protein
MSMFFCVECDQMRDSDDGCEETGGHLLCSDCADELAEEGLYPPDRPLSSVEVIIAIEGARGDAMLSGAPRAERDYAVAVLDKLDAEIRALVQKSIDAAEVGDGCGSPSSGA